jgi:hypothetical protein
MKINAFVGVLAELVFTVNTISGKLAQEKEKYGKSEYPYTHPLLYRTDCHRL